MVGGTAGNGNGSGSGWISVMKQLSLLNACMHSMVNTLQYLLFDAILYVSGGDGYLHEIEALNFHNIIKFT